MKYRDLIQGVDSLAYGDEFLVGTSWTPIIEGGPFVLDFVPGTRYRRPVREHNWISFKDRKPTKEDALSVDIIDDTERLVLGEGRVLARHINGKVKIRSVSYLWTSEVFTHWMPLNFIEDEPARIKVGGKEIVPQKDGSVKLSCGTIIPKEDVKEFIRQYNEVTK